MRLLKNRFLITADGELNSTLPITSHNGERLKLDKRFDPYRHSTQIGQIAEVPCEFSESSIDSHLLKKGDTVWFHHSVCQPKNEWLIAGKEYYQAPWELIWAKVEDGKLIPLNEWLFIEPIPEEDSDRFLGSLILRDDIQDLQHVGIVFAGSERAKNMGIQNGDKIHFIKNADYEIEIEGKKLWRMKIPTIVVIERDGMLIPLSDKVLIKENERPDRVERFGLSLPISEGEKQRYGIVESVGSDILVVKDGDGVCFLHGVYTNFMFKDQEYAIIRKENLISIFTKTQTCGLKSGI